MNGKCEVFEKNWCTGCEGLIYDIDKLKLQCETFENVMYYEKGEQMKWNLRKC